MEVCSSPDNMSRGGETSLADGHVFAKLTGHHGQPNTCLIMMLEVGKR